MRFSIVKNISAAVWLSAAVMSLSGCVKDKFDAPPVAANTNPTNVVPNTTIGLIKNQYAAAAALSPIPIRINDDLIFAGVINADDKSGNFYKVLCMQDPYPGLGGGIQIKVDQSNLYNDFPVGRMVFVKCKGLYIYNYAGTLEIGGYIDTTGAQPSLGGIPAPNLSAYVIKGMTGAKLQPKVMTVADIQLADQTIDQSTLIQVNDVEFQKTDTSKTYADAINKGYGNLTLLSCTSVGNVVVRSSGYANFAVKHVATGHGSVTGIFTIYQKSTGNVSQLGIRDLNDVQLTAARCN